jgi:SAM-dependent methyltransferase
MSSEATKSRRLWDASMLAILQGEGIDIGCGDDPITPRVDKFDLEQGDAQHLRRYVHRTYDFVFASHVLEHMKDPRAALQEWYSVVRSGGHLIVLVPDEDLYEQGCFPSLFNDAHQHTFTISKAASWSPVSVNLLDLALDLRGEIVRLVLQDHGYDRRLIVHAPGRWPLRLRYRLLSLARRSDRPGYRAAITRLMTLLRLPVDQTSMPDGRMAQIELVVRKPETAAGG